MTNISISLISDMIGKDLTNSAFVYGVYSLFDKFANGAMLYIIIQMYSDQEKSLRYIISFLPIVSSILSLLLTFIGEKFYGHKLVRNLENSDKVANTEIPIKQ